MDIIKNIEVPTGNILIAKGSKGLIEFLSLGDYGQAVNLNQHKKVCLLYTSPSPRDGATSRMPSSA